MAAIAVSQRPPIFTPLTRDTGRTNYIIDEFGVGLVITVGIGALFAARAFVRRRA